MRLQQLRDYEKAAPAMVARIKESGGLPARITTGRAEPWVSGWCAIGPNAQHGRCNIVVCKCPCHDDGEMYGYGL